MTFSIDGILDSLAGVLKKKFPDCPVYTSPNQQGTECPCFFVFFMPSSIDQHIDNRYLRDLGIDIVFVQQRNIVNRKHQIYEVVEYLEEVLLLFPYTDGDQTALIRTEEHQWHEEDDELHYQFYIRQRVSLPDSQTKMQRLEENYAGIKE